MGGMKTIGALTVMMLHAAMAMAQSAESAAFGDAVSRYVALHRAAAAELGLQTTDAPMAPAAPSALAERIRTRRTDARSGDIFGPVATQIRTAIGAAITGPRGHAVWSAIEESNVHGVRLRINRRYPPGLPRPTMPGQLIAALPPLPPELEYRLLGRSLLLMDARAGIVVDILPDALPGRPAPTTRRAAAR